MAVADDWDGWWAQTPGSAPTTIPNLDLSMDEGDARDNVRNHKGEQVGYLRFGIKNPVRLLYAAYASP
jgi:hypothetical protein